VHATNDAANGTALRGLATGPSGVGVDAFAVNGGVAGWFHNLGAGDIVRGNSSSGGYFSIAGNGT
jgi:hypothetical protein